MWGELRDQIQYLDLPDCDFLTEELAARRFKVDKNLKIRIEAKADYKKEFTNSPDRADSLIMCCMEKSERQQVWKIYTSTNPDLHRRFKINWDKVVPEEAFIYVVLIGQVDQTIYGNFFFWGRKTKTLRVYDELVYTNPIAEEIGYDIRTRVGCAVIPRNNELYIRKILGNPDLFKGGKDIVYQLRKKAKIRVKKSLSYNEAGSIIQVNNMMAQKRVVVHTDCIETDRQYRDWTVEKRQSSHLTMPQAVKGFPLCRALCVVISVLKEEGELKKKRELKPYTRQKKRIRDTLYRGKQPFISTKKKKNEYEYLTK